MLLSIIAATDMELPPHTRRRETEDGEEALTDGTTSAYAEKSLREIRGQLTGRNYLRIRGEEEMTLYSKRKDMELPPHTRRRAGQPGRRQWMLGTTSAYAEKRPHHHTEVPPQGNYLRIRGEEGVCCVRCWVL